MAMCIIFVVMQCCCISTATSYAEIHKTKSNYAHIQIGSSYKLNRDRTIYKGPSKDSGKVFRKHLKPSTKKYAIKGRKHARLKKGTVVTCLDKKKNWIRIPSGWIICHKEDLELIKE